MSFPLLPVAAGAGLLGLWYWNKKKQEAPPPGRSATFQANIPMPGIRNIPMPGTPGISPLPHGTVQTPTGQSTQHHDPATGTVVTITPGVTEVPVPGGGSVSVPTVQVSTTPPASANADMLLVVTHDDGPAGDLNVRSGPGASYPSVGRAPKGSWLKRIGASQSGFANVATADGSLRGWASEQFLSNVGPLAV